MAKIELNQVEVELLRDILKRYLSELTMEIAYSDRKDFREFLKKRREFMEAFIQRLDEELASGTREMISVDRLKEVEILQGLSVWELQSIAHYFNEETIAAGVSICEESARAEKLYILQQGSVSIRSRRIGPLDITTPGKIVGWSFLVPPFRYTASAETKTPSRLLAIKSPDFYYLIHKEPKMGMKVLNNLAQVMANRFRGPEDFPEL